ncbi:MAG: ABC transporter substrate-binding protein [Clostridiales bacterium]|nr:ABC transporter substrate-binding protein [Clostridiales bacterium]
MKKLLLTMLALIMAVFACAGCQKNDEKTSDNDQQTEKPKFGIISLVENSSFTDMRDGVIEGLKNHGYIDGESAVIDYQCAGGDMGTLATIASSMNDSSYSAIFTIATPPTLSFLATESDTPLFFCAVSGPVASGVVADLNQHAENVTGTSNAIPVEDIFALADKLTPGYSKVGLISSGKESNATNTVALAKQYLENKEISYYEVTAESSADVETAANAIAAEKCDILFIPNDSVIQSGVTKLAEICNEKGIPTYASAAATVASGCFATVAINDFDIGKLTADLYAEYKNGKDIKDIPVLVCDAPYCTVTINKGAAQALKVELPESLNAELIGADE